MDIQKALETVAKLHKEKDQFHAKKIKARKRAIIALCIGVAFLIPFIIITILTFTNHGFFATGVPLSVTFGLLAFIFLEVAIIFFILMKAVYEYQENNRKKILEIINQEVNKNKVKRNE